MMYAKCVLVLSLFTAGVEASYPTACSEYSTCQGLQGNCCPNQEGVNLACCFSGALLKDAAAAEAEAKKIGAEAETEEASAKKAASNAQSEADTFKQQQEAAAKELKTIQAKIDDLNEHATAAQKIARQAAAQATQDATVAANQAQAAEAAAEHAKKVEAEQAKIVTETSATAQIKKAAAEKAQAKADKLNDIAGAATKKLNDAKKKAQEEAAAAAIQEKAEEKVVAAKTAEANKIAAEAATAMAIATKKKNAAEAVLKKIDNAACAKHAGCKGLEGYCCPTLNFSKMHLGSSHLDGENLGCCGGASELESEEVEALSANSKSEAAPHEFGHGFGLSYVFLAFVVGSAVTAAVLKSFSRPAGNDAEYQYMPTA